jgi:hypothetical protein
LQRWKKALLIDKDVLTNEEKNEIVLCAQRLSEKLQSTNRDEIQEALQLLEAKTQPFIEKKTQ